MEPSTDTRISLLEQAVNNMTREYGKFRDLVTEDMHEQRRQTHEWMQVLAHNLPNWAVVVGGFMCTTIGAMAIWILTHH